MNAALRIKEAVVMINEARGRRGCCSNVLAGTGIVMNGRAFIVVMMAMVYWYLHIALG